MLDGVSYYDKIAESDPEKLLDFADWMGIAFPTSTGNYRPFLKLLSDKVESEK